MLNSAAGVTMPTPVPLPPRMGPFPKTDGEFGPRFDARGQVVLYEERARVLISALRRITLCHSKFAPAHIAWIPERPPT